ncbi:MAG: hypothetical protein IIT72_01995 [Lachnospiraceae bacterium]|nr:hypothetical protein [Lachnospiraceae bacterium]MBQ5484248.1 hypothetical protein [Lachnospiraceae bacterium]
MTWREQLLAEIEGKFGKEKTLHFDRVLLPNIVADFAKELSGAKGAVVSETYHVDDGSLTVVLTGSSFEDIQVKVYGCSSAVKE